MIVTQLRIFMFFLFICVLLVYEDVFNIVISGWKYWRPLLPSMQTYVYIGDRILYTLTFELDLDITFYINYMPKLRCVSLFVCPFGQDSETNRYTDNAKAVTPSADAECKNTEPSIASTRMYIISWSLKFHEFVSHFHDRNQCLFNACVNLAGWGTQIL